ncbi:cell agglutination protein Mam3 [Basidiobolus ranarum]|uniref:Cell agglutination protein Mam3 n=1 Tax=Basidiobolus ranarum TaxID=34480 RepID=A0ABR2VME4_9FUNG
MELRQSICSVHPELRDLYRFSKHEENLVRFHEYGAVAVAYSTTPNSFTPTILSEVERFTNGDDLIGATSIFAVVCKMFAFELEFEDEEDENMLTVLQDESISRRSTGAQVIEYLTQTYEALHAKQYEELLQEYQLGEEAEAFKELLTNINDESSVDVQEDLVTFRLIHDNDSEFTISRKLLSSISPIFKAMLLGEYVESKQTIISLPEAQSPEFMLLLSIIEQVQSSLELSPSELIPTSTSWTHVISLIDLSDKYILEFPKLVAELWLLRQMALDYLPEIINEIVVTYRFYGHKVTEQKERSMKLRHECTRRMAKRMTLTAFSTEFKEITEDIDETAKFVEDIANLIQTSDPKYLGESLGYSDGLDAFKPDLDLEISSDLS